MPARPLRLLRRVRPLPPPALAGLEPRDLQALPPGWRPLLAALRDDLVELLGARECRYVERIEAEPDPAGGLRLAPVLAHGIGRERPDAVVALAARLARATAASYDTCSRCGASGPDVQAVAQSAATSATTSAASAETATSAASAEAATSATISTASEVATTGAAASGATLLATCARCAAHARGGSGEPAR